MTLIVKFDCEGSFAPAYSCNIPGNNSGAYVKKEDYDDAIFALLNIRNFMADKYGDVDPYVKDADKVLLDLEKTND